MPAGLECSHVLCHPGQRPSGSGPACSPICVVAGDPDPGPGGDRIIFASEVDEEHLPVLVHRVYGGDRGRVADARPCLLRDGARRQGTSRAACLMTAPRTACLLTLRRVMRSCRASCRHRSSHVRPLHPPPRLRHKQNLPRLQQAASGGLSSPFSAYLVSTCCKQHCRCLAENEHGVCARDCSRVCLQA